MLLFGAVLFTPGVVCCSCQYRRWNVWRLGREEVRLLCRRARVSIFSGPLIMRAAHAFIF